MLHDVPDETEHFKKVNGRRQSAVFGQRKNDVIDECEAPFYHSVQEVLMATNPPKDDGHRNGAVKQRSQVYNPKNDTWTVRDKATGEFMRQKADGKPSKGIRKEKK